MPRSASQMRLFVASTEELAAARDVVTATVEQLNQAQGAKSRFKVVDWSAHVAEQMSEERKPLLHLEPGDIFLGLAWLRFGAPSAEEPEPASGDEEPAASAEEEFELAYRSCASSPSVSSLFYRCMQLPTQLADISGEQLMRVENFFARFGDGTSPGQYSEYGNDEELVARLTEDLGRIREAFEASTRQAIPPPVLRDTRTEALPEYAKKMQTGKAYEVSFLAIEMMRFAEIAREHPGEQESVETLHRSFKQLVLQIASAYGGEVFSWDAEQGSGLLMFWSKRSFDHAIITGLKVIHSLPVFNLDPLQNPLGLNLEIRTAAHDAVIVFKMPINKVSSADIDFLHELRGTYTASGELCVTKRLLERADSRLKARFKSKGRFENEPIFCCRLPATERHALRSNLDEVIRRVKTHAAAIKTQLARLFEQGVGLVDAGRDRLDGRRIELRGRLC